MILVLLIALFVVVPFVEISVVVQIAHRLGYPVTLTLLLGCSLAGGVLVRREGSRAWRSLRQGLAAGRLPTREVVDGALILFGGALLLTPGFVTDALGVLCVAPPTRALIRQIVLTAMARRLRRGARVAARTRWSSPRGRPSTGPVIEGEVTGEATESGGSTRLSE